MYFRLNERDLRKKSYEENLVEKELSADEQAWDSKALIAIKSQGSFIY